MRSRFKVPAVFTEHEVVADVESPSTEKSAVVRMDPTPAILLSSHMASQLRLGQVIGADQFKDGRVFVAREGLEGVHFVSALTPLCFCG